MFLLYMTSFSAATGHLAYPSLNSGSKDKTLSSLMSAGKERKGGNGYTPLTKLIFCSSLFRSENMIKHSRKILKSIDCRNLFDCLLKSPIQNGLQPLRWPLF